MRTARRKLGNSTGLIVPRALLRELGIASGAQIDLRDENGRLVGEPIAGEGREGWATAASELADEAPADEWLAFANENDADLRW